MKGQWKYCDYKVALKIRSQPVAKILFTCLLLRNAYITLHSSQIGEYMEMVPPTIEEWCKNGPRYRPIPGDSIFNVDYNPDAESDSDSDIEDEYFE